MPIFSINGRIVGETAPPLIIAELGINHEGSLETAITMAKAAIDAGVEIIKHQTHVLEDEMSLEAHDRIPGNADVSIYEIMKRCALTEDEEFELKNYIEEHGVLYMSTPFSRLAVERLSRLDISVVKIGSGECNNLPLVREIISLGKPIIMSTGMNTIESIRPTVSAIQKSGLPLALLHCTNLYPTPPHLIQLGAIAELRDAFPQAVVGFSDHSIGPAVSLAAVALGAAIVERHFTDHFDRPGPDIICSMDPNELEFLIRGSLEIWQARGGGKGAVREESVTSSFAFSSVVALRDIHPGETLTSENVWVMRPGGGEFGPQDFDHLLGAKAKSFMPSMRQIRREWVNLNG